jgi:hypothetical protein
MKYLFFILFPSILIAQTKTGFTFTRESGNLFVRQFDTITTSSGTEYRTEVLQFPDTTSAASHMLSRKNALFEQAARWAQKAHADSTSANRLRHIGSDARIFIIDKPIIKPLEKTPEIITVPPVKKSPAKKPKKKKTT